jgi:2,4-dienoyl-CoA reductase-like NADH-dependent reductase (Old Yellow Enzyme family)
MLARDAGFDGVELLAQGYICHLFPNPLDCNIADEACCLVVIYRNSF